MPSDRANPEAKEPQKPTFSSGHPAALRALASALRSLAASDNDPSAEKAAQRLDEMARLGR